jgi:ferredoxin
MNMLSKTLQDLIDYYPTGGHTDFYVAYLYLKHMDQFLYNTRLTLGIPAVMPDNPVDLSVHEMLQSYIRQIAVAAPKRETNIYHGKVMRHNDARKIISLDEAVNIRLPEKVLPFAIARDVVLEGPPSIALGRCACRTSKIDPCVSQDEQELCLIMGDPFASFIADNNPNFRKCARDEAINVLEKAHANGNVHAAYFKKEFAGRLMALCNCCSCCCMGMIMWNRMNGAVPFLEGSGHVAEIPEECDSCEICVNSCPFLALSMDDSGHVEINTGKCMGCGVCVDRCPSSAISLRRDPERCSPLDIEEIIKS